MGDVFPFCMWVKVCVFSGYGKGKGRLRSAFSFFAVKEERWSEIGCKKAQKKIIPAVPFAFIISLACLSSPDRILLSF